MKRKLSRIMAFLLAVTLVVSSSGFEAFAAEGIRPGFDPDMVQEMAKIVGSEEEAAEVLQTLYEEGFVDRKGMPTQKDEFNVNGVLMTEDELRTEAAKHVDDEQEMLLLDGARITWGDLKSLLAVREMQEYLEFAKQENYSIDEKDFADFTEALKTGEIELVNNMKLYSAAGTDTPQEGYWRVYLKASGEENTYLVDYENTDSSVLDEYNLRNFQNMTYEIKENHVYEDSEGRSYFDIKALSSAKAEEASRVTVALGTQDGGMTYSDKHVSDLNNGIRYTKSSLNDDGSFVVTFSIIASRDTTIGTSSVDMYIENGDLIGTVPVSLPNKDITEATDHITIEFKNGENRVSLKDCKAYFNVNQFDPSQIHEAQSCELMTYFTFRNCINCVVGMERHHVWGTNYTSVFNYGTYEVVPYYIALPLMCEYPKAFYRQIGGNENQNYDIGDIDDETYRSCTTIQPALVVPKGIYHPGDRIPFKIKFNTWLHLNREVENEQGWTAHGFSGTVKINGQGQDNNDGQMSEVIDLTGPMNDDYFNTLYGTYICKRTLDSSTLIASDLSITDTAGMTKGISPSTGEQLSVFQFTDGTYDEYNSFVFKNTEMTKVTFSNSDFLAAGQAIEEEIGKGIDFSTAKSSGNIAISSPDKSQAFDFKNASYIIIDGENYVKVPVIIPNREGTDEPEFEWIAWITSDVVMPADGKPYLKSLLAANTVRDAEGRESSFLEKVYISLREETFEYTDSATGQKVRVNEIPEYIYMKAELDGSEDGSFAEKLAGSDDCTMMGSMELVGLRNIGGTEDITKVLPNQTPSTMSEKIANGEWCRLLVSGASYDALPTEAFSGEAKNYWFDERERDRSYSQYLILPVIDFAKIHLAEEDVDLQYNSTWMNYTDETLEDDYSINGIIPKIYDKYAKSHPELTVSYSVHETNSKGQKCDYTNADSFTWKSSDPTIANVSNQASDGVMNGVVSFTGKAGKVHFILENEDNTVTWESASIEVSESKEPFMYIPSTSELVVAMKGYPADVVFCSNIPTYNDKAQAGCTTTYKLDVFPGHIETSGGDTVFVIDGESVLEKPIEVEATAGQPVNSITIPEGILNQVSESGSVSYVAELSVLYTGSPDSITEDEALDNGDGTYSFVDHAAIKVKNAPVKVQMKECDRYCLDNEPIKIEWSVLGAYNNASENADWNVKIFSNDEVAYEQVVEKHGARGTINEFIDSITIPKGLISENASLCNTVLKTPITITVSLTNDKEAEAYSVASTTIYVYNSKAIDILVSRAKEGSNSLAVSEDGDHVTLDNEPYVSSLANADGTIEGFDLTELQTDITLQAVVSLNYGEYVWGLVSDQMNWKATDEDPDVDAANLYYSAAGTYSNVDHSLLPSYMPISTFALVGEKEGTSTITATHAATGCETSITVDVHKLEDKLYLFQFYPIIKTELSYTDSTGEKKTVYSKDNGQLVLYEPNGIMEDSLISYGGTDAEGVIYSGFTHERFLITGERNEALGELYPVNVLELSRMEEASLFIKTPDGKPLKNANVTIHGGVYYKNDVSHANVTEYGKKTKIDGYEYMPKLDLLTPEQARDASQNTQGDEETSNGLEALTFTTDDKGMIRVVLNTEQVRTGYQLRTGEDYLFVFQVEVPGYKPQIATHRLLNENGERAGATIVQLAFAGLPASPSPYIVDISEYRYMNGSREQITIDSDVKALGADTKYPDRDVQFDTMLWNIDDVIIPSSTDTVASTGADYYNTKVYLSDILKGAEHNKTLGQGASDQTCSIWYYPFSTIPMATTVLKCNKNSYLNEKGDDFWLGLESKTKADWAIFKSDSVILRKAFPYEICNNLTGDSIADDPYFYSLLMKLAEDLKEDPDANISDMVPGGDMLAASISILSGLATGGDHQINVLTAATADPMVYKVLLTLGDEQGIFTEEDAREGEEKEEGIITHFGDQDPKDLNAALDQFMGVTPEEEEDEDKLKVKFGGALIGEAKKTEKGWDFTITGGSITVGVEYEVFKTDENFFVGPVPVTITFGLKAGMSETLTVDQVYHQRYIDEKGQIHDEPGTDITGYIPWEKMEGPDGIKKSYGFLMDACLTGEVEAFAGVGFDYSVVALKLGIFGKVTANAYWAMGFTGVENRKAMFGTGVSIEGQIALQFKAQLLFLTYVKNFASVSFDVGYQTEGYTELLELFHSPTMMDEKYAGGYAGVGASFMSKEVSASTKNSRMMASGESILKRLEKQNDTYGKVTLSDDNKVIFYTDNFMASYASANGVNRGVLTPDVKHDGTNTTMDGKGDFGHFYLDGCGKDNDLFATWVVQTQQGYEGSKAASESLADLSMALNSTEVVASVYDAEKNEWKTTPLSDNNAPDMSPSISSYGTCATVVWRSLYGSSASDPLNFNVDDNLVFKYFDGTKWSDKAIVIYNGSANGKVQAVDSCMLDEETVVVVFTVQTDPEGNNEGLETYYALFDPNPENFEYYGVVMANISGAPDRIDENAKIVPISSNEVVIAWSADQKADGSAGSDIRLIGLNVDILYDMKAYPDASIPESVSALDNSVNVTGNYDIYADEDGNLTIGWAVPISEEDGNVKGSKSEIYVSQLTKDSATQKYDMTTPMLLYTTSGGTITDEFKLINQNNNVSLYMSETVYEGDPVQVDSIYAEQLIRREDYGSDEEYQDAMNLFNEQYPNGVPVTQIPGYYRLEKQTKKLQQELLLTNVYFERTNVIPGLSIPVVFAVKNTGIGKIDTIKIDDKEYTINLAPNEQTKLNVLYTVPNPTTDVNFEISSPTNAFAKSTGTLHFNIPKVDIGKIGVVAEGDGSRTVSVLLENNSFVPLDGSGRTVEIALYTDLTMSTQVGEAVTVEEAELVDLDAETVNIDVDIEDYVKAVNENNGEDIGIGTTKEIPEDGIDLVAIARVKDSKDEVLYSNAQKVTMQTMCNDIETPVVEHFSEPEVIPASESNPEGEGTINVSGTITNESIMDQGTRNYAVKVLDTEGKVIAEQVFEAELTPEHEVRYDCSFTVKNLGDYSETVVEEVATAGLQTPEAEGYDFLGWYTDASCTTKAEAGASGGYALWKQNLVNIFGVHLILSGDIGMVFHADIADSAKDGYMVLTAQGQELARINTKDALKDEVGRYRFECYLSSIQMSEDVTATYYWGEGKSVSAKCSIEDYAEQIITGDGYSAEAKDLVKSLINYGHYSQICLSKENGWVIGEDYAATSITYGNLTATAEDLEPYAVVKEGSDATITDSGMTLLLGSQTSIKLMYTASSKPTATVDGMKAQVTDAGNGQYYVLIPNIGARSLGKEYTVVVNNSLTYRVSALSYANIVLNGTGYSEEQKNEAKALYEYYSAANSFAEALTEKN